MRRAAVFLTLMLAATGCAVTSDESVAIIDQTRLDETLQRVTTTTTSTTLPVQTSEVAFFLLTEATDEIPRRQVQQVKQDVPESGRILFLIQPMFEDDFKTTVGFPDLINRMTDFTLVDVTVDDPTDVATVILEPREGVETEDAQLKDVAAQLVWTITGFPTVESILIRINGDESNLTLLIDDGNTSEPVTTADYDSYNPEVVDEPVITTTTSEPSTTTTTVAPTTTVEG